MGMVEGREKTGKLKAPDVEGRKEKMAVERGYAAPY
jgi:hypothetical protein